jgi:hypothetical protein
MAQEPKKIPLTDHPASKEPDKRPMPALKPDRG